MLYQGCHLKSDDDTVQINVKKFKKESSLCTVSTHWCCNYRNYQGQLTSQHQKDAFFNVVVILMCDGLMFFSEKNCKNFAVIEIYRVQNSQMDFRIDLLRVHFDAKEFGTFKIDPKSIKVRWSTCTLMTKSFLGLVPFRR